jgi:hypothetical protein
MAILLAYAPDLITATANGEIYFGTSTGITTVDGRAALSISGANRTFSNGSSGFTTGSSTTCIFQGYVNFISFNNAPVLAVMEAGTVLSDLWIASTGAISFRRGSTTIGGPTTALLSLGTWYYIQAKWVIHDSTGSVVLKINGTEVINATGLDSRNGGTTGIWDSFRMYSQAFNNLFLADDSGSDFTDLSANVLDMAVLTPNGAGNSTQFTPSSGSNYQTVDELPVSQDDYNESSTDGHKDTFTLSNTSAGVGTIHCVIPFAIYEGTTSDPATLATVIRHSSSEATSTAKAAKNQTMDIVQDFHYVNPSTTAAWSKSELDAAEAGYVLDI